MATELLSVHDVYHDRDTIKKDLDSELNGYPYILIWEPDSALTAIVFSAKKLQQFYVQKIKGSNKFSLDNSSKLLFESSEDLNVNEWLTLLAFHKNKFFKHLKLDDLPNKTR